MRFGAQAAPAPVDVDLRSVRDSHASGSPVEVEVVDDCDGLRTFAHRAPLANADDDGKRVPSAGAPPRHLYAVGDGTEAPPLTVRGTSNSGRRRASVRPHGGPWRPAVSGQPPLARRGLDPVAEHWAQGPCRQRATSFKRSFSAVC